MTRSALKKSVQKVVGALMAAFLIGIVLKWIFPQKDHPVYATYKDMIPVILGIPAAYLAYCFNLRNAHLQTLRALWSNAIRAIQRVRDYCDSRELAEGEYVATLSQLSVVIDEVRGVFKNIDETPSDIGLYPFEPLKDIFKIVKELKPGSIVNEQQKIDAKEKIETHWRHLRGKLLLEFERSEPDHPESRYQAAFRELEKVRK